MGQAKRRKDLGAYPDVKPKPRSYARLKGNLVKESYIGNAAAFSMLNLLAQYKRETVHSPLTGHKEIDETIMEIKRETDFDLETAKHFYLMTGNKEFCVKLSTLHSMGYPFTYLEFLAKSYSSGEVRE